MFFGVIHVYELIAEDSNSLPWPRTKIDLMLWFHFCGEAKTKFGFSIKKKNKNKKTL